MNRMSNFDDIKQALSDLNELKSSQNFSKTLYYSLPRDTTKVKLRFLPNVNNPGEFPIKITFWHFNLPKNEKGNDKIMCPRTYRQYCKICDVVERYIEQAEWIKNYAVILKPKCNILPKDATKVGEAQIIPNTAYLATITGGMLNYLMHIWETEGNGFVDPVHGRAFEVWREKKDGKANITPSFNPSPIAGTPEEIQHILSTCYDLNEIFKGIDDNTLNDVHNFSIAVEHAIQSKLMTQPGNFQNARGNMVSSPNMQYPNNPPMPPQNNVPQYTPPQNNFNNYPQQYPNNPPMPPQNNNMPPQGVSISPQNIPMNNMPPNSYTPPQNNYANNVPPQANAPSPQYIPPQGPALQGNMQNNNVYTAPARPENAPECFANPAVHDPRNPQCARCNVEFLCENTINKK
jgi:hypothetical protein